MTDKIPGSISVKIKELRQRCGMTQKVLSEKCGVNQSTISRIENGMSHNISANLLFKVSQSLGVTGDYLMSGGYKEGSAIHKEDMET